MVKFVKNNRKTKEESSESFESSDSESSFETLSSSDDSESDDETEEMTSEDEAREIEQRYKNLKKNNIKLKNKLKNTKKQTCKESPKSKSKSKYYSKNTKKNSKKHGKKSKSESEYESEYESDDEDDDDEDDEDDEEDETEEDETDEDKAEYKNKKSKKKAKKSGKNGFLVFNIGGGSNEDYGDEDYDDDEDENDYLEAEEEDEYKEEEEKIFMKETYQCIEEPAKPNKKPKTSKKLAEEEKEKSIEEEYTNLLDTKKFMIQKLKQKPNKIYEKALNECNESIRKLVRKGKKENTKKYHELLKKDKKKLNEYEYFRKQLSNKEQTKIIKDICDITEKSNFKPYRFTVLESNLPKNLKEIALHKISQLQSMTASDNEYFKIKNWVDNFMKIPFGIYKSIDINIEKDGLDSCNEYMNNAQVILDECVYGLVESKLQIMQMLGNWLTNPQATGTTIAIQGEPGTGKTSLIKDGISKILGREFVFIPLGGAGDASYLEGHSYTYEGSVWGKIVQSLMNCKCMNPVFYFDELDKVSDSPRGQEIIGILTHLTDTSQNMNFQDKYFSEINGFDLSKCLFIFSYNDETNVSPVLLNRMYIIHTKGYVVNEKLVIAQRYVIPKICDQVKFTEKDIVISDEMVRYILENEQFCKKEGGVRNLKRCLEIIYTKLNLFRIMKPDSPFFKIHKGIPQNITFPYNVIKSDLDLLLKNDNELTIPSYKYFYV